MEELEKKLEKKILHEYAGNESIGILQRLRKLTKTTNVFTIDNIDSTIRHPKTKRIQIDMLRLLKSAGYDVADYEIELTAYNEFATEYVSKFGRANVQIAFYNYYLPLTRKFGSNMSTVDVDDAYRYVTSNNFTTASLLEKVLSLCDAPDGLLDMIEKRERELDASASVKKVLQRHLANCGRKYQINKEDLQRLIASVGIPLTEIANASYAFGLNFVKNRYRDGEFCQRNVDLLCAYGWPYARQLDDVRKSYGVKSAILDSVYFGTKTSTARAISYVEKAMKCDLLDVGKLSDIELERRLNAISAGDHPKIVYAALVHHLGEMRMNRLDLSDLVTGETLEQKLIKKSDEWTVELYRRVMAFFAVDSESRASVPENHMTKLRYVTVCIFTSLLKYVDEEFGNSLQWFFHSATIDMLTKFVVRHGREIGVANDRVKNRYDCHHAKRRTFQILRVFKSDPIRAILQVDPSAIRAKNILYKIENLREISDVERVPYSDDEIDAMFDAIKHDPKWTLILTIFREVGLRVGAVCNLKVCDMIDRFKIPLHEGSALEKGNKRRTFVLGPNLKRKTLAYISRYRNHEPSFDHETTFLFNIEKNTRPSVSSVESRLRRIGREAGLDRRVYPHLFRHTLVGVLEDNGNLMSDISKFMGHSSVDTTQKWYRIKSLQDVVKSMNNPFYDVKESIDEIKNDRGDELQNCHTKLETCMSIIGGILRVICPTDIEKVYTSMPNLDKVVRAIADSTADSTSTMSTMSQRSRQFVDDDVREAAVSTDDDVECDDVECDDVECDDVEV